MLRRRFCCSGTQQGLEPSPTWARTSWTSTRKLTEGEITCDLIGILTKAASKEAGRVHPKAMSVILIDPEEWETWLRAPWAEAAPRQRPLPDGALPLVARRDKQEGAS